jgi:hypothetical protein
MLSHYVRCHLVAGAQRRKPAADRRKMPHYFQMKAPLKRRLTLEERRLKGGKRVIEHANQDVAQSATLT